MQAAELFAFIPLILMSIPLTLICYSVAKEKGKNAPLWAVLGIIPVINFYSTLYLVGAVNRQLEEKISRVLALLEKEGK